VRTQNGGTGKLFGSRDDERRSAAPFIGFIVTRGEQAQKFGIVEDVERGTGDTLDLLRDTEFADIEIARAGACRFEQEPDLGCTERHGCGRAHRERTDRAGGRVDARRDIDCENTRSYGGERLDDDAHLGRQLGAASGSEQSIEYEIRPGDCGMRFFGARGKRTRHDAVHLRALLRVAPAFAYVRRR
jgi:hypothetical protein